MEVERISMEYIKPSSPTSPNQKTHKLCLLDQFRPNVYAPRVLYYPLNHQHKLSGLIDIHHIVSKRLQLLKQSLSEALVRFYPLAGKMTDHFSVDCNDDGVYFVEAVTKSPLNEFLKTPDVKLIRNKFFPSDDGNEQSKRIAGSHVAKVQVTSFSCGGIVVCACISHMFGDGSTFSTFMKSWTATARKSSEETVCRHPNFDAVSLFPPNDVIIISQLRETFGESFARFCKTGRVALRRLVFGAEAIAKLKAKATNSSRVQNPTRVESVSAVISMAIMAAIKTNSGSHHHHKPTLISHAVNLRPKARPPLSEHLVGNIVWHTNALCIEDEVELDGLVFQLRETIKKFDGDFVKSIQGSGGLHKLSEEIKYEAEAYTHDDVKSRIMFTSWCKFGFYDIDFGWGKPSWVSLVGFGESIVEHSPTIVLMDTRSGDGIEAWVSLLEEDMALLSVDKNILAFATLDPSPADFH